MSKKERTIYFTLIFLLIVFMSVITVTFYLHMKEEGEKLEKAKKTSLSAKTREPSVLPGNTAEKKSLEPQKGAVSIPPLEQENAKKPAPAKKPKPAPPSPKPEIKIESTQTVEAEPPKVEAENRAEETSSDVSAEAASPGATYLIAGHKAFKQKDYNAAVKYLKKSVEKDPALFLARYWLGRAYIEKGKHSQAVQSLEKAVELRSEKDKDIDVEYFLAWEYIEDSSYDRAVSLYRERISKNPDNVDNHFGLAFALKKTGNLDESAHEYRKAIELNPAIPSTHYNLANTLEEMGKPDDAVSEYKKAIELNPDYGEAYFNMGVALAKAGRTQEAIEAFNKCIEMGHRDREAKKQIKSILKSKEE